MWACQVWPVLRGSSEEPGSERRLRAKQNSHLHPDKGGESNQWILIRTFLYMFSTIKPPISIESKGDWRLHWCLDHNPADWFKRKAIFGLFLKSGLLTLATAEAMMTSSYVKYNVGFCSCVKSGEHEGTNGRAPFGLTSPYYCRSWILPHVLITDTVKDCRFSHSNYGCKSNMRRPGSCP